MTMSDMDVQGLGAGVAVSGPVVGARAGQAKRRTFSPGFKLRVLAEFDALTGWGERGAYLRREGLYASHVNAWRKARDGGSLVGPVSVSVVGPGVQGGSRSGADSLVRENERLKSRNDKLVAELARTKAVMEVLGKAHALLEIISESADIPKNMNPS
jgi:transposase